MSKERLQERLRKNEQENQTKDLPAEASSRKYLTQSRDLGDSHDHSHRVIESHCHAVIVIVIVIFPLS